MDVTITGRNLEITDRFRDYVNEKAERVARLVEPSAAFEVRVLRHMDARGEDGGDDRVELTVIGRGPLIRGEASGIDKYAAFDLALDKLLERVRQAKDRRKVHRGQHAPVSLSRASAQGFDIVDITPASPEVIDRATNGQPAPSGEEEEEEAEYSPVVVRKKTFRAVRMAPEEAVDHMELVGHDFFLFIDDDTGRPSVVYRRKGWDYGVICLADGEGSETDLAAVDEAIQGELEDAEPVQTRAHRR